MDESEWEYEVVKNVTGRYLVRNTRTGYYSRNRDFTYMSFATAREALDFIKSIS